MLQKTVTALDRRKSSKALDLKLFQDDPYADSNDWDVHISWKRHLPEPFILLRALWGLLPIFR